MVCSLTRAHAAALGPGHEHGLLGGARRGAVGDDGHLGVLDVALLKPHDVRGMAVDLAEDPLEPGVDLVLPQGGEAGPVVQQAGDVVAIAFAKADDGRHIAGGLFVGKVPFRRHGRRDALHDLKLAGRGQSTPAPAGGR